MGSSRRRNSTRARRARSVKTRTSAKTSEIRAALDRVLVHFNGALCAIETLARALEAAENDQECQTVGSEIATLRHGVIALRAVYTELDLAIPSDAT
jgi:hypothetical protein